MLRRSTTNDVYLYIVKRTQIYIEETQDERLAVRAKQVGRTKSELIRDAIDEYFGVGEDRTIRLDRFRSALGSTFGAAAHLPPGEEYVESLRLLDHDRIQELEARKS